MLYQITGNAVVESTGKGRKAWTKTVQLPTFYLDSNVQGITSVDHARRIAGSMLQSVMTAPSALFLDVIAVPDGAPGKALRNGAYVHIGGDGVYGPSTVYLQNPGGPCEAVGSLNYYPTARSMGGGGVWGVTVFCRASEERFSSREDAAINALAQFS